MPPLVIGLQPKTKVHASHAPDLTEPVVPCFFVPFMDGAWRITDGLRSKVSAGTLPSSITVIVIMRI
jgi:hypothetical protein